MGSRTAPYDFRYWAPVLSKAISTTFRLCAAPLRYFSSGSFGYSNVELRQSDTTARACTRGISEPASAVTALRSWPIEGARADTTAPATHTSSKTDIAMRGNRGHRLSSRG